MTISTTTNQLPAPPPRKSPVPRKLNQGTIDALSLAVSKGNYNVTACQLAGVSDKTLYEWLAQAEVDSIAGLDAESSLYVCLAESLKRAEAYAEAKLVDVVRESAEIKRDWLPAITFLERRHPDRWGRRERRQIDINETKTIRITHVEIAMTELGESPIIEGESRELPAQSAYAENG